MNLKIDRRIALHAALASGLGLLLPTARACEYSTSTMRILHPWARQTEEGAKVAAVCMRFDEVRVNDRLIGVFTPVATGAELGGTDAKRQVDFAIPEGVESTLSEDGTFVRLTGLKQPLEVGRAYPLTLVFEKGGTVQAELSIDFERFI